MRLFSRLPRRAAIITTLIVALFASILPATPAHATVGRPNTAEQEVEAYYNEFLNRPSDSGGYGTYINRVYEDCRYGILAAGMMIGDAGEAHRTWPTPEAFVTPMFRALLNRNPDSGGYNTYVNVIRSRGYRWAIVDIQSSVEFRNRLAAMCNGRRGIVGQNVLKANDANNAAIDLSNASFTLFKACGVGEVLSLLGLGKLKKIYAATEAIKTAKFTLAKFVGKSNECKAAFKVLVVADQIIRIADTGGGVHNPTYVLVNLREDWQLTGRYCIVKMGYGRSAPERTVDEVKFRC